MKIDAFEQVHGRRTKRWGEDIQTANINLKE
jgi:hypothetical protein